MANTNNLAEQLARADETLDTFPTELKSILAPAVAKPDAPTVDGGSITDALEDEIGNEYIKAHPIKDAAQWLKEADEPPRPLINELIERGSCVAIVGPAKSAKTWLEIETAVCIATGREWFGRTTTQQIVYVANIEVSSRQYKKRLRSICKRLGIDGDELKGKLYIDNLRGEKASFEMCLARAKAIGAQVVIIDPFYQVFKGSEKDDAQCQEAIEEMKRFLKLGITLIMVFHAPKGLSGDRQTVDMISGSSVLVRFPENVVAILPHATDKDARVIDCSVLRDYAPPDPFSVKFDDGALVLAPDITTELKSGRATRCKSPAEREAEKIQRHNDAQKKIETACRSYLDKCGDTLPGTCTLSAELRKIASKGDVELYLQAAKQGGTLDTTPEMMPDGNGGWKKKPPKDGGKTFISTPERIAAYRRKCETLPFE